LRIVTLNTWKNEGDYPRRLFQMAEGLANLRADVVCLQECFAGGGASTVDRLASVLGMFPHRAPSRRKLRQHGPLRVMSTSGLAILTRDPSARANLCALVSDPRDGQRIAQRVDLVASGHPLRILNLHLTHLGGAKAEGVRAAQLTAALIWATADYEGGLVLAGDLNATAADSALAALELPAMPATLHGPRAGTAPSSGLAIDHCVLLRKGGWRTTGTGRALDQPDGDGWFPSDHAAVVLDLLAGDAGSY
jgi:endonuclease/exonuclease/phosphatase family metal-dependent hydrolase